MDFTSVVNKTGRPYTSQNESTGSDADYNETIAAVLYVTNYVILCILGIVGNVLNIIVLRRCGFKDTNVLFLESLSLADLILSVVHSALHAHNFIALVDVAASSVVGSYVHLSGPFNTLMCAVQCHLVAIAFERAIAVYFPFHAGRIFTRTRVVMCIVSLYALTIVLYLPLSLIFEVSWAEITGTNQTLAVITPTRFFLLNHNVLDSYLLWGLGKFTDSVLPGTTIVICCTVVLKLWRRKKQFLSKVTKKKKKKDSNDLKGVRLLMAVCVVSALYAVPAQTMIYYFAINDDFSGQFHQLLVDFTDMINQFFSSTNFIIYVTMSKKFLQTYRKLVCGCR